MEKDNKQIIKAFQVRQNRQYLALAVTLLLLVFLVFLHKRSDIFGEISRQIIFGAQLAVIVSFIVFSALNWRCPACNRYLGTDIYRHVCKKCGTRLQ